MHRAHTVMIISELRVWEPRVNEGPGLGRLASRAASWDVEQLNSGYSGWGLGYRLRAHKFPQPCLLPHPRLLHRTSEKPKSSRSGPLGRGGVQNGCWTTVTLVPPKCLQCLALSKPELVSAQSPNQQ